MDSIIIVKKASKFFGIYLAVKGFVVLISIMLFIYMYGSFGMSFGFPGFDFVALQPPRAVSHLASGSSFRTIQDSYYCRDDTAEGGRRDAAAAHRCSTLWRHARSSSAAVRRCR